MDEKDVLETVKQFEKKLPKFEDGRIDYHGSDTAPVLTVFVKRGDRILLMKRSDEVRTYKGRWNTVAGYLDEVRPLREKVLEELGEEVSITEENISSIRFGEPLRFTDADIDKTWISHPVLVTVKEGTEVKTDWEHTEYRWIKPEELQDYDTVPKLEEGLERVLS
ncbi:MAG: NUDIX domain-containing protein [Candidatus Aenigmatarchaeota archaeon]